MRSLVNNKLGACAHVWFHLSGIYHLCQIRLLVLKIYEIFHKILLNNFRKLLSITNIFKGCGTVIGMGVRGGHWDEEGGSYAWLSGREGHFICRGAGNNQRERAHYVSLHEPPNTYFRTTFWYCGGSEKENWEQLEGVIWVAWAQWGGRTSPFPQT